MGRPVLTAEVMEKLENSMAEIDQMMADLRTSIGITPPRRTDEVNGSQAPRFQFESSPMENFGVTAQVPHPNRGEQGFFRTGLSNNQNTRTPEMENRPMNPPSFRPSYTVRQTKPNLVPDRFDGRTPVADYLNHFEACIMVNHWEESEAMEYLAASLRGSAVKLPTQQTGRNLTYNELVDRMKKRYGPGGKAEVYLAELRQRRRGPKETLQELGQSIRDMTSLAYPEFDESGQDRLARGHFLDAIIDSKIREGLFRAQPRSLDEAIEAALNTEAFLKMEGERKEYRHARYSRAVTGDNATGSYASAEDTAWKEKMEKSIQDLILKTESKNHQRLRQNTRQYGSGQQAKKENNCYNCGELGHFSRNCPHPRKGSSERTNIQQGERRCHICNQTGHLGENCPNSNAHATVESNLEDNPTQTTREQPRPDNGNSGENRPEIGQARVGSSKDAQRQGLFIDARINEQSVTFLLDTGSSHTLISEEVYGRITEARRPSLRRVADMVYQADGSPLDTMGRASIIIQIGGMVAASEVIVAALKNQGILGLDLLIQMNTVLDLRRLELRTPKGTISCKDHQGRSFCCRIVAQQTSTIPAGCEVILPGEVKSTQHLSGTGLLEGPPDGAEISGKGLIVARAVVSADAEVLPVRILNTTEQNKVVKKGTFVASLSSLKEKEITVSEVDEKRPSTGVPEHLRDLLTRTKQNVPGEYHESVAKLLEDFSDVFSTGPLDIGRTNYVQHSINTGDTRPFRQAHRRYPAQQREEIDRQVRDLLKQGLIEPTSSPWASNVVLVAKKDGSKRFCVDYRQLNAKTIKDAYPLPRINDTLDALGGARWFSTLDLASGYWQVELDEEARQKSAFLANGGLYTWRAMPFGLCNAPATFERLMDRVVAGLKWEILLVYLDDVIVYGRTIEDELERLRVVFQRLREAGLKLKPSKCHLFCRSVQYLGHVVSAEGVSTDPEKVEAVRNWITPTSVSELRSFMGLASYYRRYVKGFAEIARPLHQLMEKNRRFEWTSECQSAFEQLKERLTTSPILAYPEPDGQMVLDTDASNFAVGAVLSQIQNGQEKVIAYASKTFKKAERNYCVTRKELLAIVIFLKHFRQYLYGRHITVRTDHGSLRWLTNFKKPLDN